MVTQALDWLAPEEGERILDLFCGLGNFSLPIARKCEAVVGVEGDGALVARARRNAEDNAIHNARFYTANLYDELDAEPWMLERFDAVLLDPPRSGAAEMVPLISKLGARRILYVSCYPGTLARDAGMLVNEHGYRLARAGIMDMFPHTAHVESMALLVRGG
jgi:23S rRNA (uracil1939-C5)-methyltransferase